MATVTTERSVPRLKGRYRTEVVPALQREFNYRNPMQVPKLVKIVLNISLKEAVQNAKVLDTASEELARVSGQKPAIRRAKRSIANFKLRAGIPIGTMVTLRGDRMYEFFDRFVSIAIPRVRDFRGFNPKAFDGRGNYSLGITEQIIFPEIDYDKIQRITGMNITFVTTATTDAEAKALLDQMGLPFRK
ncbi:50S ribosomal protein L5 [Myxococcota bacterium]|nr:50S ribosomal protein L5 [Myxococcota bacterium]